MSDDQIQKRGTSDSSPDNDANSASQKSDTEFADILENLPEEEKPKFLQFIKHSMSAMMMSISRSSNPVAEKITSDHITALINNII
jgi:spore coat protein CotF